MADKIFYTVIVTSLLIAIIIIFFVISVIRYHQRYIALQKERIHAEIMMQELERKRIANDLHDSLGPLLSTVKLYIHSVIVDNKEDEQLLNKAGHYIDETVNSLREISYNLLPASLNRNGLVEAVREYISRLNNRQALKIEWHTSEHLIFPKNKEIHVFRIIQEIVHNTIKHSGAAGLQLSVITNGDGFLLTTVDDGAGFDQDEIKKRAGGLGLKSIESRCEIINADLQIITSKHKGCKYVIRIPGQ